jgi:flagellin
MSLVVNTNVSSLTAQRSLAESAAMLDQAMERLSSGSKINSASDDAAGLAIVQRMTAQIQGLNMAVKNANDGIAMTQSIEGALVEVSDMLQRLRELSIQAANATNTDVDRSYIQEEVNLLIAEVSRIAANTRYNGQLVLDGSYKNVQLQVGTEGGEIIQMGVDSVAANKLGAFKISGDRIEAVAGNGAGSYENATDAADDIIVNGASLSKKIDVLAKDSAKAVAAKINAVSGETKVTAEAQTYAYLYSEYATDQTYSVLVNNKTTGYFAISSSNVQDAVDKINAISGSTGVTATSTTDNKVLLHSVDGADILVENQSTGTALRVQSVGFDGESVIPQKAWHTGVPRTAGALNTGTLDGAADGTYTLQQKSTGTTWTFTLAAAISGGPTAAELESAINSISGVSGFKVSSNSSLGVSPLVTATVEFGDFDIYSGTDASNASNLQTFKGQATKVTIDADDATWTPSGGAGASTNYILRNSSTGKDYTFTVTSASASGPTGTEILTGLNALSVGTFELGPEVASGGSVADAAGTDKIIYGPAAFGNWTILAADGTATDTTVNVEGDLNLNDVALAAGGSSNDAATVQGTIELSSSKAFSVTQSDEVSGAVTDPKVATGSRANDNYFVTRSAVLQTVSNIDLRSTKKAGLAISVIDGAIEKISSMRAELGAIENRLTHTVSNLMNVAENTASAKSRLNDADYSIESANLAKSQVLQQAGTAMLAQANARSQLVLQLLQ